jgi:hypothetical protein
MEDAGAILLILIGILIVGLFILPKPKQKEFCKLHTWTYQDKNDGNGGVRLVCTACGYCAND